MLGNHYTLATAKQMRAYLGLDQPLWTQYGLYMAHLLQGNMGTSIYFQQPVTSIIFGRLAATLWLVVYAGILAGLIAVPLAILSATRRNGPTDQAVRVVFMVALAMPAFWTGVVLILILGVKAGVFPVSGFGSSIPDHLYHMFLPSLTIALGFSAILIRSLRNSILLVLRADYIEAARAKGLPGRSVMFRHVLRNALLPTLTIFGVNIAFLMGSTVIVENVFALGGIGQLLVSSILQRDYAVVQGITLLLAAFVVAINLLTDVLYTLFDPRVSYD
jgi:peptide/nickel transport system permease protein